MFVCLIFFCDGLVCLRTSDLGETLSEVRRRKKSRYENGALSLPMHSLIIRWGWSKFSLDVFLRGVCQLFWNRGFVKKSVELLTWFFPLRDCWLSMWLVRMSKKKVLSGTEVIHAGCADLWQRKKKRHWGFRIPLIVFRVWICDGWGDFFHNWSHVHSLWTQSVDFSSENINGLL